jgi:hypothetical protein
MDDYDFESLDKEPPCMLWIAYAAASHAIVALYHKAIVYSSSVLRSEDPGIDI